MPGEPDVPRRGAKARKAAAESEAERSGDRLSRIERRLDRVVELLEEVQADVARNLENTEAVGEEVEALWSGAEEWRRRAQETLGRRRDRRNRRGADRGGRGGAA